MASAVWSTHSLPHVDWRFKGFPPADQLGRPVADLAQQGWNLRRGDSLLPSIVLKRSALTHNIATMADYCREHGVVLVPHAKTSMAPQLLAEQRASGAWGFTVASTSQAVTLRALGFDHLLLASQMVEPQAVRWVAEQLRDPAFEFLVLVDSLDAVAIMDETLRECQAPRPLRVLVELGQVGGRTGCRTPETAEGIVRAVRATSTLEFAGVEGFEGLILADTLEATVDGVDVFLASLRDLVERLARGGAFDHLDQVVVSAGGSAYFDRVIEYLADFDIGRPVITMLRSGCYVTHDHEMYESTSALAGRGDGTSARLIPAFELWGAVWSRPEPNLAIVGIGKRDAPTDYLLPLPLCVIQRDGRERPATGSFRVTGLNDQHAYLWVPDDDPLAPGDRITFGISHPCTAFDKWRLIPVVDDEYNIVDAIETFF